jgi:hypothetical protein
MLWIISEHAYENLILAIWKFWCFGMISYIYQLVGNPWDAVGYKNKD